MSGEDEEEEEELKSETREHEARGRDETVVEGARQV